MLWSVAPVLAAIIEAEEALAEIGRRQDTQIVLMGGSARLHRLDEFLAEQQDASRIPAGDQRGHRRAPPRLFKIV